MTLWASSDGTGANLSAEQRTREARYLDKGLKTLESVSPWDPHPKHKYEFQPHFPSLDLSTPTLGILLLDHNALLRIE